MQNSTLSKNLSLPIDPSSLKRWTTEEYHQMSELGLLQPEERTELIAGQILLKVAKGRAHVIVLQLLAAKLQAGLGENAHIRTQNPITLDNFSEPEPDLVIVQGGILDYADHHPRPNEILLVVEVADSILPRDCEVKDKIYAQNNINEYWVLDLPKRQLHIYQTPTPSGYASHLILAAPNQIACSALPGFRFELLDVLPPEVLSI